MVVNQLYLNLRKLKKIQVMQNYRRLLITQRVNKVIRMIEYIEEN